MLRPASLTRPSTFTDDGDGNNPSGVPQSGRESGQRGSGESGEANNGFNRALENGGRTSLGIGSSSKIGDNVRDMALNDEERKEVNQDEDDHDDDDRQLGKADSVAQVRTKKTSS